MLDAAARLFGTQRFHEVRMEDIATEAEVGKGTIYRYFNDKEELYLALVERASRQLLDRLRAEVARTREQGARQQLKAMAAGLIAFFDEQPHLLDLIQRAEALRDAGRGSPWKEARHGLYQLAQELFQAGRAQGVLDVLDCDLAAWMLLGGLRNVIRFSRRPRAADLAERIIELFLDGADRFERTEPIANGQSAAAAPE